MPRSLTCPRCFTALRVPADSTNEFATCPRCLAQLSTSGQGAITATPARTAESEGACPECGEPVAREWQYCPNCEEPLWDRGSRGRRRSMELDVRRDNTLLTVSMILLAVLGGVGISLMLLAGLFAASEEYFTPIPFMLAALFVVGVTGALTVVFRKEKLTTGRAIGLAAFRSLTFAGIAFLLVCLYCVAVGIYVFVTCLQGGFR